MRILAVIVIAVLSIMLVVLSMLTFVILRDNSELRACAVTEAENASQLSAALDRVLAENEQLRQSNEELERENANLVQQLSVVQAGEIENPEADSEQAFERRVQAMTEVIPMNGAVLDNGRSDRRDFIEWVFDWPDVPGATRYNLYVIGGRATIPAINTETEESAYVHLALSAYILDSNREDWTWKVRALVDGDWSEWSDVRTFDVEPLDTDPPTDEEEESGRGN